MRGDHTYIAVLTMFSKITIVKLEEDMTSLTKKVLRMIDDG